MVSTLELRSAVFEIIELVCFPIGRSPSHSQGFTREYMQLAFLFAKREPEEHQHRQASRPHNPAGFIWRCPLVSWR